MPAKGVTPRKYVRLTQEQLDDLIAGRTDQQIADALRRLRSAGRPPTVINLDELIKLAELNCTLQEMADYFKVGIATIKRKLRHPQFRALMDRGRATGRVKLRSAQYLAAVVDKNPTMLIWMGKQMLEQKDRTELTGADGAPVQSVQIVISKDEANI